MFCGLHGVLPLSFFSHPGKKGSLRFSFFMIRPLACFDTTRAKNAPAYKEGEGVGQGRERERQEGKRRKLVFLHVCGSAVRGSFFRPYFSFARGRTSDDQLILGRFVVVAGHRDAACSPEWTTYFPTCVWSLDQGVPVGCSVASISRPCLDGSTPRLPTSKQHPKHFD